MLFLFGRSYATNCLLLMSHREKLSSCSLLSTNRHACCSQGKDKPTFSPWKDSGDVVVVKNARHVDFTGRKWEQKVYRWHTGCGYPSRHLFIYSSACSTPFMQHR